MKQKQKGFTLIELIVVMAIIAILVLIASPKFMGYTEKAKLTQVINDIKVSEKAAEQYYLQHDLWPRDQTATAYTDEQLTLWVNDFRNLSGETVTLEDGKYYDVDWELMKTFMAKPDNYHKYIIQNPVGDIYYANDLTSAGEQTKFAGDTQETTEPQPTTEANLAPIAVITITPETNLFTNTTITWSTSKSTDPDGDSITNVEWEGKQDVYATAGSYLVKLRVQDEHGLWSDWIEKSIIIENSFVLSNKIVAGNNFSLVVDEDGQLWSFGINRYGQLGHSNNINTDNPVPIPTKIMIGTKVVEIATGGYHSLAIDENNQLWSFGYNYYGQLGSNANLLTATANPTPTKIMLSTNVIDVDAGTSHTLVLDNNNQLWSFGYNKQGQLGHSTNSGTMNPNSTPTKIIVGTNVKSIFTGDSSSFAIDSNNQLWSFGQNYYGQLGHSTRIGTVNANAPTKVMIGVQVSLVSTGSSHTLVLDNTNQLWSFGSNRYGQLGYDTNKDTDVANYTPTKIMIGTKFTNIDAGGNHSLVLDDAKQVWSFGYNYYGQLGHNTNIELSTANSTPTKIMNNIVSISSGNFHSLLIDTQGKLLSFGLNQYGSLGNSTNIGLTTPNFNPANVNLFE